MKEMFAFFLLYIFVIVVFIYSGRRVYRNFRIYIYIYICRERERDRERDRERERERERERDKLSLF